MEWQLVGRKTELTSLRRAVERGGGAVLVGPAGVGKTRLAAEAVAARDVRWVAATADAATIPYGPLVAALPGLSPSQSAGTEVEAIRADLDEIQTLVVDDAHLLDAASATLIHHLAIERAVPILATIRVGEPTPEAVNALWKDVDLPRFDLNPLDRSSAFQLTQEMLGGPADPHLLETIWERSLGGPLEIRELVLSARELDALDFVDDVWVLSDALTPTQRVSDLIEGRLSRLSEEERQVAELLAYSEGTEVSLVVDVADRVALNNLERARIASYRGDGAVRSLVELAHPLYGEVLRDRLPVGRRVELAGMLSKAVESLDVDVDPLRLAIWRFEAGLAHAEELAAAGRTAVGRMAYSLAFRLGAAALDLEESYRAHTVVAASLAEEGRLGEAEPHFRRAEEMAPSRLYSKWALFGYAWYLFAERPHEALELLRKEIAREGDPEVIGDLRAGLAILLVFHGNYKEAADLTAELLDREPITGQARLLGLVARAKADAMGLLPANAAASADGAWHLIDRVRTTLPNAEDLLHTSLTEAELIRCQTEDARRRVESRLRRRAPHIDDGLWRYFVGRLQLWEGDAESSYQSQMSAIRTLERSDPGFTLPLAIAEAAHAATVLGRHDDAVSLLESIPPARSESPRVRLLVQQVLALTRATTESLDRSASQVVEIGDEAESVGDRRRAAHSWHLAVRLGRPELVDDRLRALANKTSVPIAELYADHASQLADRNPGSLEEIGRSFAKAGLGLLAAEAFSQASEIHRETKEPTRARRCSAAARECLPEPGARTPALIGLTDAPPLTRREREVALLAVSGLSSRSIAHQLDLSVRTVDNHLGSVYMKVGVSGRTELANVFAV